MKYYVLLLSFLIPYHQSQGSQSPAKCAGVTPMIFHKKQTKMPQYQSISEQIKPRLKKINHALDVPLLNAIEGWNSPEETTLLVSRLLSGNEIPDVNTTAWGSTTPLMLASRKNLSNIVKLLIDAGAHVNAKGGGWNSPILNHAAAAGNATIVKMLINAGADLNATDIQGMTALMQAAMRTSWDENINISDYASTIKMLLRAGANPYIGAASGKTVFDYAKKRSEIEKIFLDFEKLQTPQHKQSLRTAAQNIIAGKFPRTRSGQERPGKMIQEFLRPTLQKQEEIKQAAQT